MAKFNRYRDTAHAMFGLRVMTCALVLYDHISAKGTFFESSDLNAVQCLRELQRAKCLDLIVVIQCLSLHVRDPELPELIRNLIDIDG